MLGMEITFDWSWVYNLGSQPYYFIFWHFLKYGGWALFAIVLVWGGAKNFIYVQQGKFFAKQKFVFLALDVPKENLQTPRAVENIFSAIAGAHMPGEFYERKWKGEFQLSLSFEIISLEGYIQFIIMAPAQFKDLVEASVYSQYPEAQISVVEDYTKPFKDLKFPHEEYDLWGADMVPVVPDYLPILTYIEFQEELDKEFKDPIAAMLEVIGKIGKGEHIWVQIIAGPSDIPWTTSGLKAVDKLLGKKSIAKKTLMDKIIESPISALSLVDKYVLGGAEAEAKKDDKKEINMMYLPPAEKRQVEAILRKIDKIIYNCKLRIVYVAKKEVFRKALAASGTIGALRQLAATGLNGFKPGSNKTQVRYGPFRDKRLAHLQNLILQNYINRNPDTSEGTYMLNVEELATLFHFPSLEVKTPLVKRSESKRARAPIGLPVVGLDGGGVAVTEASVFAKASPEVKEIDYDNDYFEQRFAIDKTGESDRKDKERILQELKKKSPSPPAKSVTDGEIATFHNMRKPGEKVGELKVSDGQPPNLPLV